MVNITSFYVEEPPLIFSENNTCTDPQGGLYLYGPYGKYVSGERTSLLADIGIIGTSKTINDSITFFDYIKKRIPAESKGRLDFPGLGIEGKLRFDVKIDEQWLEEIDETEIQNGKEIEKREDRIDYFLDLYERKIRSLNRKDPSPRVVLVTLPMEIIRLCKEPNQKGLHITISHRRFGKKITDEQVKGDYDFHNIIKVFGMKYELPTQLILPPSLDIYRKRGVQDLVTRAWNLAVAFYYKVEGTPWKIAHLDSQTCYAGVSFFRTLDAEKQPVMRASVAHIFLHTGECLVLTGHPFYSPEPNVEPKLTVEQAQDIRELIIKGFEDTHGVKPKRMVIFKKNDFSDREVTGFKTTNSSIRKVDLLTVKPSNIDWFRNGTYPPVRGTVLKCPGPEYLIYTIGYIPELQTYPKGGIPNPLRLIPYNMSTNERKLCREILSLSKLNWNNINFSEFYPAPVAVSSNIGQILSESRATDVSVSEQYRYYM